MSRFLLALPLFLATLAFGQIQTPTVTLASGKQVAIVSTATDADTKTVAVEYRADLFPTTHADARAQADQVFAALRNHLELAGNETVRIRAGATDEFTYRFQRNGSWTRLDNAAENLNKRIARWNALRPDEKLWFGIVQALTAPDADHYFENGMKFAVVPGGANGARAFTGTVISAEPPGAPTTIVLGIRDPHTPDATLKLDKPLSLPIEPGRIVEFEGVATSFTTSPFMLTFQIYPGNRLMVEAR